MDRHNCMDKEGSGVLSVHSIKPKPAQSNPNLLKFGTETMVTEASVG